MKNKVVQLAATDKNSHIRAGALQQMASWHDPATLTIAQQALNDSSYLVIATALDELNKLDSAKAYAAAQKLENEKSEDLADAIFAIYGSQAGPEKSDFMLNKLKQSDDLAKYQMLPHYSDYLSGNVVHGEVLQKALPVLYNLAENNEYWWLRVQSMNALVAVENALQEELNKGLSRQSADPNQLNSLKEQLDSIKEKVHEIQLKEPDARLRSMYGEK
jgi:aminopeptidase N